MAHGDVAQLDLDLKSARELAAAALPGLVERLNDKAMTEDDPEIVRKAIDTLAKLADPPKKDDGKAGLRVFNITFGATGAVTAEASEVIEMVEEVQPVVEALPEPETPAEVEERARHDDDFAALIASLGDLGA